MPHALETSNAVPSKPAKFTIDRIICDRLVSICPPTTNGDSVTLDGDLSNLGQ